MKGRIINVSQSEATSIYFITDSILPVNYFHASTGNVDLDYFSIHSGVEIIAENESLVDHSDGVEMILSAEGEVNPNIANNLWLWLDFSAANWIACEHNDCQHRNEPFDKFFSNGKPIRYCSQKLFVGIKMPMVRNTRKRLVTVFTISRISLVICS